jgi:hypothetical protein
MPPVGLVACAPVKKCPIQIRSNITRSMKLQIYSASGNRIELAVRTLVASLLLAASARVPAGVTFENAALTGAASVLANGVLVEAANIGPA